MISSDWVTKWLQFVQNEDKENAVHPGPVNNKQILKHVIAMQSTNDTQQKTGFYSVSKHLFYFFVGLYGGGPAIVQNTQYAHTELAITAVRTSNPTLEEEKETQ